MDEKGFIFTADASLALIVAFVFTASVVSYAVLPVYQGQDHQHLEALADSTLEVMEQSGTLHNATVNYANNNTAQAQTELRNTLNSLIPFGIGYRITVGSNPSVTDNSSAHPNDVIGSANNYWTSHDVATKVKVISGPQEGWMGRAYYKIEQVNFTDQNVTAVTTVWNFHNYLQNFQPWGTGGSNSYLSTYPYWGGNNPTGSQQQTQVPITFNVPGQLNSAQLLIGSVYKSTTRPTAFNSDFYLNGVLTQSIKGASYTPIYQGGGYQYYNYFSPLSTTNFISNGQNSFYLRLNGTNTHTLPWFSIIANYSTTISVPQGCLFPPASYFPDITGAGRQTDSVIYYPENGTVRTTTPGRSVSWTYLQSNDYDMSTPFVITGLPGGFSASAVGSTTTVYLPPGARLLDAYTVVNAYAACDGAIVQVKDPSGQWTTVFDSFDSKFTSRTDLGYGNLPSIVTLHDSLADPTYDSTKDPLRAGNNTVRIILTDFVYGNGQPNTGSDYDLIGLKSSYVQLVYTYLPIRWDTFPFDSYQYTNGGSATTYTQSKRFNIEQGAENALLFLGVSAHTRNIKLTVSTANNSVSNTNFYPTSSNIPFVMNLSKYDTTHIFTDTNGKLKPGNYTLNITVTPAVGYESGDLYNNIHTLSNPGLSYPVPYGYLGSPSLYSGTRISILYPQFLQNAWASAFASTPNAAKQAATADLMQNLTSEGITPDTSLIKTEALYTGDLPNSIPIRLELWKY